MTTAREVPAEVAERIGFYVYVYRDPQTNAPVYVGKGQAGRALDHPELLIESSTPRIDILRHGLTETEAFLVEAAVIDALGIPPLRNKDHGHGPGLPVIELDELIATLRATPVEVTHRSLLITINQRYRSHMSDDALYEATRGVWKVGPKRGQAEVALAVYRGVVKAVYRIRAWHPAGTLTYATRDSDDFRGSGRWEFEGDRDPALEQAYGGRFVGLSGQNPIRYVNVT